MDLSQVITGEVVTEKAENLKKQPKKVVTLSVNGNATKVDIKNALKKFYDLDVTAVRIMRVSPKTRLIARNKEMLKRPRFKKALITLSPKSKGLDLTTFKA